MLSDGDAAHVGEANIGETSGIAIQEDSKESATY